MSYQEDIKTIAKTRELNEKIDKLNQGIAANAKKQAIESARIKVFQGPTGSTTGSSTSAASNKIIEDAKNAAGDAVEAASQIDPNDTDADNKQDNTTNTDNKENSQNTGGATDGNKVGDSKDLNDTNSRTESKNQADPDGASDATWNAIKAALIANGASDADIKRAEIEYWSKEKGKSEIGDVYNGDAGPKLLSDEVLNAIVGQAVGSALYVELRLDGRETIPSAAEALAAGQLPWSSIGTPPYQAGFGDFQLGYFWTIPTGYTPSSIYGATPTQVAKALPAILDANEAANAPHVFDHVVQNSISSYTAHYTRASGGPFTFPINRSACPGVAPANACPTEPPREPYWPQVGLYYLRLVAGKFVYSLFDSEVPISAQGLQSSVKMASAATGDTYNIEPAVNGGFMITNDSNPSLLLYYNSKRQLRAVAPINQYKFYKAR